MGEQDISVGSGGDELLPLLLAFVGASHQQMLLRSRSLRDREQRRRGVKLFMSAK